MLTFFTILFAMIAVNGVLMFFSVTRVGQKKKPSIDGSKKTASDVFPIDLISSKYKKAV